MINKHLDSCDERLQKVFKEAAKIMNISITCGYRDELEQKSSYTTKHSKDAWPRSKHNIYPSLALHAVPCPTMWENREYFYMLNGIVQTLSKQMDIKILWGGDSKTIDDLAHWEIIDE